MIEVEAISKVYARSTQDVAAVQGVSLRVAPGEKLALIGPSGAGKTTLLYLLGLMDEPTAGAYRLAGKDTRRLGEQERSRLRGKTIGFVFQSYNLIPHLRVWENVALPLKYAGVPERERRERAEAMLERVGLANRVTHHPAELSGGQEQRAAIARALVISPQLVLADEPTGNLDSATGAHILALLDEVRADGATLIIVTHSPAVAASAERRVELVDGHIVADSALGI